MRRDHAGTQPQPTNLQVDRVLKSWSQAMKTHQGDVDARNQGSKE